MTFCIPPLGKVFDRVTEDWPFEADLRPPRYPVGRELSHTFPRDEVERVGSRLGEVAWTAFVDTTGIFYDEYARPLR